MDDLVRHLPKDARILDLGAGGGSFSYASTAAEIVAVDLSYPPQIQPCLGRVVAASQAIPFKEAAFDVVVCNHTVEHFERPERALAEIGRTLKRGGHLWVAVPDGRMLDDRLYQYLFEGGGHVSRFTLQSLIEMVESSAAVRAIRFKKLFSGFVYLNPPAPDKLIHYPRKAQKLGRIPAGFLEKMLRWFNYSTRVFDRFFGTSTSQYGWGVVFIKTEIPEGEIQLEQMVADENVCFSCGAGHPKETLADSLRRFALWRIYNCPSCGKKNVFCSF